MKNLYYTPPENHVFDEVKRECIKLWEKYDNTYGYVDSKVNRIKDLENVSDNFMYMVAMFDFINQTKLSYNLSASANKAIADRFRYTSENGSVSEICNPFSEGGEK